MEKYQELTADILNRLIEKIEVYSRTEEDGETNQEIKIFYRFGGYINKCYFAAMVLKRMSATQATE